MRKDDLQLGKCYTNGKGRIRKLLNRGAQFKLYDGQMDKDCISYVIVRDGSKKNLSHGQLGKMTATSFASWAKSEIDDPDITPDTPENKPDAKK